jgi:hypothetical protein
MESGIRHPCADPKASQPVADVADRPQEIRADRGRMAEAHAICGMCVLSAQRYGCSVSTCATNADLASV